MSSVLELEKLHNLLSVFSRADESLEKIVACERIREIIKKTDQVNKKLRIKLTLKHDEQTFLITLIIFFTGYISPLAIARGAEASETASRGSRENENDD